MLRCATSLLAVRRYAVKAKPAQVIDDSPGIHIAHKDVPPPTEPTKVGTVLTGLNYRIGHKDPVILEDSEYPTWIFDYLKPPSNEPPKIDKKYLRKLNVKRMKEFNAANTKKSSKK